MRISGAAVVQTVREHMRRCKVEALIVPSSDAHNSEYVARHLQARGFVSNFYGSAGTALITMDQALLWTDGRYWTAASQQLFTEFGLMKAGAPDTPTISDWVLRHLGAGAAVGAHPYLVSMAEWESMSRKIALRSVPNIVQDIMPSEDTRQAMYVRPAEFCGATCQERRLALLQEMEKKQCDLMVLSALDEIAWLTNLRGRDVEYNPVFYSYAIVDKRKPRVPVYVDVAKLTDEVRKTCADAVDFLPYEQFETDLRSVGTGRHALVDERQTSEAVRRVLAETGVETVRVACGPTQKLKAVKNPIELKGARECHVRDGAALTRYLAWLHNEITAVGAVNLNEYDAAAQLEKFRAEDSRFVQPSFQSISATGANAAVVHYSPPKTRSAVIAKDQLYLTDSGAQYWDGTTDVTRTICFATPPEEVRQAYTLVLKGHIAINTTVFPHGTSGIRLDAFARRALWAVGLDYAHGTGHGVGSFLNVHEGPHSIGARPAPSGANLELHNIVSNEPGYYKEGHYGIRIENLEEVVQHPTLFSSTGFYTFSHLTRAPLCRDLINAAALTEAERQWVNDYHTTVRDAISPLLRAVNDQLAISYLGYHTEPL